MKYNILDAEGGNVINTIIADEEFVKSNFDYYEAYVVPTPPQPTAEQVARAWRNEELMITDQAAQIPDWPNRDNILTYRQALRNWPSTSNFPDTRPELKE